jgi:hypothetical protein
MVLFKRISQRYPRPRDVQKFLRKMKYNTEEEGETQLSALSALKKGRAHCLEATLIAAAILEHSGYPPLVMSLESKDDLDHVIFIFREKTGWGAVARSRMEGLHGRKPVFKTLKSLALSYFDPFIDKTGRLTSFAVANLNEINSPWRDSRRQVWKVVNFLIELKHTKLKVSDSRYRKWFDYYKKTGQSGSRQSSWW